MKGEGIMEVRCMLEREDIEYVISPVATTLAQNVGNGGCEGCVVADWLNMLVRCGRNHMIIHADIDIVDDEDDERMEVNIVIFFDNKERLVVATLDELINDLFHSENDQEEVS